MPNTVSNRIKYAITFRHNYRFHTILPFYFHLKKNEIEIPVDVHNSNESKQKSIKQKSEKVFHFLSGIS